MAVEAIAEASLLALEIPFAQKPVRHGIVMNREQEIGRQAVGARHAPEQRLPGGTVGDEQDGPAETVREQHLLDPPGEHEVEDEFVDAARAPGTRSFRRVSHIEDDAELRASAGRTVRLFRRLNPRLAARRLQRARPRERRRDNEHSGHDASEAGCHNWPLRFPAPWQTHAPHPSVPWREPEHGCTIRSAAQKSGAFIGGKSGQPPPENPPIYLPRNFGALWLSASRTPADGGLVKFRGSPRPPPRPPAGPAPASTPTASRRRATHRADQAARTG